MSEIEDAEAIVSMSPAHFRTLREVAGLSQQEVYEHCQAHPAPGRDRGPDLRTVRRWEATHVAPQAVQEWVRECWREVRDAARAIADEHAEDGRVELTRTPTGWAHDEHWTPGMDAAVTRLALALLEVDGTEVVVS